MLLKIKYYILKQPSLDDREQFLGRKNLLNGL